MVLADFGAEVIKVEQPGEGDYAREFEPIHESGMGYFYIMLNRNKKSVGLDMKNDADRAKFLKLVESADVLVEGFRPGVAERLGISYDTLAKINPGLIYCAITGFGQNGPYRLRAGHDLNYMSLAGATSLVGTRGTAPTIAGLQVADLSSAMTAINGILLAILARQKTGKGQFVDISMHDSVLAMMPADVNIYFCTGEVTRRGESWLTGQLPNYNVYETKDQRHIALGAVEKKFWANICKVLGREDLIETFGDEAVRNSVFDTLIALFKTKEQSEWIKDFAGTDTCFSPVMEMDEVFADPHVLARDMVVEVDDPKIGRHKHLGMSIKLSDTPGTIRSGAPVLGADDAEILGNL
jgi:crotonobetainyl-CoA:carnitine CoA-transferase CaiB-like acyl-CoA transferase